MNAEADRLAEQGAVEGRPPIKDLDEYRSRVRLVSSFQRMAVRIVEARDPLESIAPEAKETQSRSWFKTLTQRVRCDGKIKSVKRGTSTHQVETGDRDELARGRLQQRSEEG